MDNVMWWRVATICYALGVAFQSIFRSDLGPLLLAVMSLLGTCAALAAFITELKS